MRVCNVGGRLVLGVGDPVEGRALDVARASGGRFGPDVQAVYAVWDEFREWAAGAAGEPDVGVGDGDGDGFRGAVGAPVPRPPQVFAIGVNYRDHAVEAGLELPERPMVFTKFPAAVTGPYAPIVRPAGSVDFEVELVAVIGRRAENVPAERAWSHVAGLTAGQDLSERELQLSGPPPQQFNMGKSFTGFAPIGPALVTPDEFADPDDIEIGCLINGVQMQKARTNDMVFPIPELIAFLSSVLPLLPGDLIFTGTPSGIGWARTPRRLLQVGDELVTEVEQVGQMRHTFVAPTG